jgi:hypothetical protein
MKVIKISIIIILVASLSLVLSPFISKRHVPANVKAFIVDYKNGNIPEMDSVQFWGIEKNYGAFPGNHYIRSKLIDYKGTTFTSTYCHIELDSINDTIISIQTSKQIVITDSLLHIKHRIISDTNLSEPEVKNYKTYLKLKSKYNFDQLSSDINISSCQFWFNSGRLYYKWFPPVQHKIYEYDYWAFPSIKVNDSWLYCSY